MGVTYKKLMKLLIDRDMKKKDLAKLTSLSAGTMAKLSRDEYVSLEILVKICHALNVSIEDIMEVI